MTSRTQSKTQGWFLLGHEIAGQVTQAGEVWKLIAKKMCDQLPPGEDVDRADIKDAIECVKEGAAEAGELLTSTKLRSVLLVGRRNYDWLTSDISYTAMEEMGDEPRRFEYYADFTARGEKLTKRKARALVGGKLDSPVKATEEYEEYLQLLAEGDEDRLLDFLVKHPKIRAYHDQISNKAYGLDEDGREAAGRGHGRDPEWDSAERLNQELERFIRNARLRLQCVAENLGPTTPRTMLKNNFATVIELMSMGDSMMDGITSIEQFLAQFPE